MILVDVMGQIVNRRRVIGAEGETNPYARMYLTIESTTDNNVIYWYAESNDNTKTISVSTDDGVNWTSVTSSNSYPVLATLNTGDKLLIKGNNASYTDSGWHRNTFYSDDNYIVYGNIMSLIYGDNFMGQTEFVAGTQGVFTHLFYKSYYLESAENLVLPCKTLVYGCYYNMFYYCESLVQAPKLPATTLADYCYDDMFAYCTSLTTAPELPATTLEGECYYYMFYYCYQMSYVKCLATDISASGCTDYWLYDVASEGTFVKAASMNDWYAGGSGIPSGWTIQNV